MTDVENGPLTEANRECRDILCCLLFIGGMVVMVALSIYGYQNGDLNEPFRGVDQSGNICGDKANSATANLPYIYYFSPQADTASRFCVDSCPVLEGTTMTQPSTTTGTITWDFTADADGNLSPAGTPTAS